MHKKRIYLNISLFLLSFCCGLLLLEGLFRILALSHNSDYNKLKWGHWENPETIELYKRVFVYDTVLGYEKKDIFQKITNVLKNKPKSYKILVLGDSITQWGKYVDYFDNLLAARYPQKIEVINAGVMGYDTELEYRYLKYRGMDLRPNLVILQFCMNDFKGTPVIIRQKDGSWLALNGNKKIARWINPKLIEKSKLYEFIALRLLRAWNGKKLNKDVVKDPLQKTKQLLEKNGIPFYVIVFPWLAKQPLDEYKLILNILDELNLSSKTIDLSSYFSDKTFDEISKDSTHPNEDGDRIAAQVLFNKLTPFLDRNL